MPDPFVTGKAIEAICDLVEKLDQAILQTIQENLHLADGENCTLINLKKAIHHQPAMTPETLNKIKAELPSLKEIMVKECEPGYSYGMLIPHKTLTRLWDYAMEGVPMGGFLQAVMRNDLFQAVGRADSFNKVALPQICKLIYNQFPMSMRNYDEWIKAHYPDEQAGQG